MRLGQPMTVTITSLPRTRSLCCSLRRSPQVSVVFSPISAGTAPSALFSAHAYLCPLHAVGAGPFWLLFSPLVFPDPTTFLDLFLCDTKIAYERWARNRVATTLGVRAAPILSDELEAAADGAIKMLGSLLV